MAKKIAWTDRPRPTFTPSISLPRCASCMAWRASLRRRKATSNASRILNLHSCACALALTASVSTITATPSRFLPYSIARRPIAELASEFPSRALTGSTTKETNAILDALAPDPSLFGFCGDGASKIRRTKWCWTLRSTATRIVWLPLTCGIWPKLRGNLGFEQSRRVRSGGSCKERNMRRSNVALRLQTLLLEEAKRVAESEGVALNQ